MTNRAFLAATVILGAVAIAAKAEDPQKLFDKLYGDEAKKVGNDAKASATFAAKLLTDSKGLKDAPDLAKLLLEKVYDYGCKDASGCATAAEAAKLMMERVVFNQQEWQDKAIAARQILFQKSTGADKTKAGESLIEELLAAGDAQADAAKYADAGKLYQRAYQVASTIKSDQLDDILSKLEDANAKIEVAHKVAAYLLKLNDNPKNAASAKTLVLLYVVELDKPANAEKWVAVTDDDQLRKLVPLAAKKVTDLPEHSCMELADWYKGLAAGAGRSGNAVVYERAKGYYEQFLALHEKEDAENLKAKKALEDIKKELARLPASKPKEFDLMKLIDPEKDTVEGKWAIKGGELYSDDVGDRIRIPFQPPLEYDYVVEFTRIKGNDGIIAMLSKDKTQFYCVLGAWNNAITGIGFISGQDIPVNPTKTKLSLTNGRKYRCVIQVRENSVKEFLDGKQIVEYKTDFKDISANPYWNNTILIGIGSSHSPTVFHSIKLLEVSGKGKVVKREDAEPAKDQCRIPTERRGNTDWFSKAGWGVFTHYLYTCQCSSSRIVRMDGEADWNKCVNEFDTEKFADQLKEVGAPYVIFTMLQRARFIIAPNATYDRLTGYKPGEACSKRDLVEDLYHSLHKRGIVLMLYWTGDGPLDDPQAARGLGYATGVPLAYVKNWAEVAAEYGQRYKDKVAGYWVDGCYGWIGYNEEKWTILANGLRRQPQAHHRAQQPVHDPLELIDPER